MSMSLHPPSSSRGPHVDSVHDVAPDGPRFSGERELLGESSTVTGSSEDESSPTNGKEGDFPAVVYAVAARFPPELFLNVIQYVSTRDGGREFEWYGDPDLSRCSLVCLYWAQKCRHKRFEGKYASIATAQTAALFVSAALSTGSKRLKPIIDILAGISVQHELRFQPQSWHHILVPRIPPHKLHWLVIDGPAQGSLPPRQFRSPHIGLPRSLPAIWLPYPYLALRDMHFASMADLLHLVRNFRCLEVLELRRLTWDGEDAALQHLAPPASRSPPSLSCIRVAGCPADFSLFSHVTRTHNLLSAADVDGLKIMTSSVQAYHNNMFPEHQDHPRWSPHPSFEYHHQECTGESDHSS